MISRIEAAEAIATALEDQFSCSVWSAGNQVRVYLTEVTYKSRGRKTSRENGFVSISADGSVDCDGLDRQRGTIGSLIADLNLVIEACQVRGACPVASEAKEEIEAQFEASARSLYAAESARELG